MNTIHGWPSEIRPEMTRPAGQSGGAVDRNGPFLFNPGGWWDSDAGIAHFLGTHGVTCAYWNSVPRGTGDLNNAVLAGRTKFEIVAMGATPKTYWSIAISRIDAYCLKLAIQARNAPHASNNLAIPKPVFRPAGQATAPSGISPLMAGLLGAAIGGAIGFFAGRR